jgi:signal transduction histidine kinase
VSAPSTGSLPSRIRSQELKLTVTLEAGKHQVFGDTIRLQQIFWNIFQNAAKFSRPHDSVTVHSRNSSEDRIVIEVTDIGIGIEPEFLPKVFDAFEQGDSTSMRQYSGLGLGLMISRVIVKAHGGMISAVSSGRDHGTTLIIDLPIISEGFAPSVET